MKKSFKKSTAFMAVITALFLGLTPNAQDAQASVDLGSYSEVFGATSAGPDEVSFAASHAENEGFVVIGPDFAVSGNSSSGSAVQFNGVAEFGAGGYSGGEMASYGCFFDTAIGASTYSQVGGAVFNQYGSVDTESAALAVASIDYGWYDVSTYADGISYSIVDGNGGANAGYDAYAEVYM